MSRNKSRNSGSRQAPRSSNNTGSNHHQQQQHQQIQRDSKNLDARRHGGNRARAGGFSPQPGPERHGSQQQNHRHHDQAGPGPGRRRRRQRENRVTDEDGDLDMDPPTYVGASVSHRGSTANNRHATFGPRVTDARVKQHGRRASYDYTRAPHRYYHGFSGSTRGARKGTPPRREFFIHPYAHYNMGDEFVIPGSPIAASASASDSDSDPEEGDLEPHVRDCRDLANLRFRETIHSLIQSLYDAKRDWAERIGLEDQHGEPMDWQPEVEVPVCVIRDMGEPRAYPPPASTQGSYMIQGQDLDLHHGQGMGLGMGGMNMGFGGGPGFVTPTAETAGAGYLQKMAGGNPTGAGCDYVLPCRDVDVSDEDDDGVGPYGYGIGERELASHSGYSC